MSRVLLPHQKANVAILIGLLAALPAEAYNHNYFGFGYRGEPDGDGCALGLAAKHADKFTDENGKNSFTPLTSIIEFSDAAFGEGAWDDVFTLACTGNTKADILDLLTAYGKNPTA